jgi:oxygen-dependent protoporphyrinogen oxidase
MSRMDRWIIVGGGASGLATAFFLRQLGMESEIVEKDANIGGRMGAVELGGRSLDCGGKNIGRQYKLFRRFAASLGSHPFEYFGLNSSQVIDGEIKTFDSNRRWSSMLELVQGVSSRDAVRFARLLWRVRNQEANGYLGSDLGRALARRYDTLPVSHYFSPEFCRRIIRPMSVRMNGAEPDEIYMGNVGSNVRMLLDTYEQFRHGLAPVLSSFANQYKVHVNTATEALLTTGDRITGVRVKSSDGTTNELHGAGVIVATPAPIAAALTEPILPELTERLRAIAYYPVALVLAEYDRPIFSPTVRALVFDGEEALSNAGAYGVNDLQLVRYTFSGRRARRHISKSTSAEGLLRIGEASLARHIPVDARWRRRFVARNFQQGLCAYTPHHFSFIDGVHQALRKAPGLYVTGDYMQGASIEACFRSASACVRRLTTTERYQ